jgi:hypothetical protein
VEKQVMVIGYYLLSQQIEEFDVRDGFLASEMISDDPKI